ncbi:MAG: pyruvate kinase [Candidatus Omnitrophota bacterium]|nr:pyruvate kinase [Candidatus Omnitrophota bacterium]
MVKTKIICTLGPASSSETTIRKMMLVGMDVARLNFSHGTHQEQFKRIEIIRRLNKKYRRDIKILQDLEGFRIRVGRFKNHATILLKKRQIFYLTQEFIEGNENIVSFDYEGAVSDIKKGIFVYIYDGNICLKVLAVGKNNLKTEVIVGGPLKENKGINIPQAHLNFLGITVKDKMDLIFGIKHKVNFIAQSFVRNKKDILDIREIIQNKLPNCKIIAKIENREGIKNIDEIINASDMIMIARGDMGVSLPIYEIPILQKEIIRKCNQKKKPVITATQMLENMVEHTRPTRAEVADCANAILDGTDFVMLSAETAVGKYPVEAVSMMNEIIKFTEQSEIYRN